MQLLAVLASRCPRGVVHRSTAGKRYHKGRLGATVTTVARQGAFAVEKCVLAVVALFGPEL